MIEAFKKFVKKTVAVSGYQIVRSNVKKHPQNELQITAKQFFDLYFSLIDQDDFYFVQLGANDGKTRDFMYEYITKYRLRGLLVEMQKNIFTRLQNTYADYPNVQLANEAIGRRNERIKYYKIKESFISESNLFEVTAISSLDKQIIKRSLSKRINHPKPQYRIEPISNNLDDYIEETPIDVITFDQLLTKYGVPKIDFLYMDCDGSDHLILQSLDFTKISPKIISYESVVLSDKERLNCENLLTKQGYDFFRYGNDTCAFKV